jgi:hypothetical protein
VSRWWALVAFVAGFWLGIVLSQRGFKKLLQEGAIIPGPNASPEITDAYTKATNS